MLVAIYTQEDYFAFSISLSYHCDSDHETKGQTRQVGFAICEGVETHHLLHKSSK